MRKSVWIVFGTVVLTIVALQTASASERFLVTSNHMVERFDTIPGPITHADMVSPNGVVIGPDRNIYVTSGGNSKVMRFDWQTGDYIDEFVTNENGRLSTPSRLTFGPNGNLFVGNAGWNEILEYDGADGSFVRIFAATGGMMSPAGMAFGPDGDLYAVSSGSDEVLRYDGNTGVLVSHFVPSTAGLDYPTGLAFGPDGTLYVSNYNTSNVLRFDSSGAFIDEFVTTHGGGLNGAYDLGFTCGGDLLVLSRNTQQVLRYDSAGVFQGVHANLAGAPTDIAFVPEGQVTQPTSTLELNAAELQNGDPLIVNAHVRNGETESRVDAFIWIRKPSGSVVRVGRTRDRVLPANLDTVKEIFNRPAGTAPLDEEGTYLFGLRLNDSNTGESLGQASKPFTVDLTP